MKIVQRRLSYSIVNGRLRLKLWWNRQVLTMGLGIIVYKESESGKVKWDLRHSLFFIYSSVISSDRSPRLTLQIMSWVGR